MNQNRDQQNKYIYTRARASLRVRSEKFSFSKAVYSTGLILMFVAWVILTGWVFADESTSSLIKQLSNKDAFLRKSAAAKLGVSKDPKAIRPLIKALKDSDPEVRGQAADSLGLLRAEQAIPNLAKLLEKEKNKSVNQRASLALANIPGSDQLLLSCLNDKNVSIQIGCVQSLGRRRVKAATPHLTKMLKNSKGSLRVAVIEALINIGDMGDVQHFQNDLKSEDYLIQVAAIKALGIVKNNQSNALLEPFLKELNPGIRVAAAWSLAKGGEIQTRTIAEDLLFHPDVKVRQDAAETLAFIKQKKSKKPLYAAMKLEKNPGVKKTMQFAIQGIERK